ncbi:hypothetical protein [Brevundimonas sp.]|uniref:hypothetical protein n=1 Tax=Brevundimonas sp. TaxID=1871086 RepID=UPI001DF6406A|nr:hypothetical protein [Brevundimonas sp.]MBA3999669.1 hypothetical protein [Brevundimonas sp.]
MQAASFVRIAAVSALGAAALAACAPMPAPGPVAANGGLSTSFSAADFAWSSQAGNAVIEGRTAYGPGYACAGSVGLTPETPYTRHRFLNLYGSLDRAALPASEVRARSVGEASADYRGYVRDTTCDAQGRFRFDDLPQGGWFIIAPVRQGSGEPVVLMRRVETGSRGAVSVTLD